MINEPLFVFQHGSGDTIVVNQCKLINPSFETYGNSASICRLRLHDEGVAVIY